MMKLFYRQPFQKVLHPKKTAKAAIFILHKVILNPATSDEVILPATLSKSVASQKDC